MLIFLQIARNFLPVYKLAQFISQMEVLVYAEIPYLFLWALMVPG